MFRRTFKLRQFLYQVLLHMHLRIYHPETRNGAITLSGAQESGQIQTKVSRHKEKLLQEQNILASVTRVKMLYSMGGH